MAVPPLQDTAQLRLGVEKRLVLHILRYQKYEGEWEVPDALTQDGIARALSMLQNNVSRAAAKLEAERKIAPRLCHIKGSARRKKAYFLTDEGKRLASGIEAHAREEMIIYDGNAAKLGDCMPQIASALSRLGEHPASISELVECYLSEGKITAESLQARRKNADKLPEPASNAKVSFIIPPARFIGRKEELHVLRGLLPDASVRFVVVKGIAGIGKTTLAKRVAADYQSVFWFSFGAFESMEDLARELQPSRPPVTPRELASALSSAASLVVLDDLQNAPVKVSSALAIMRDMPKKAHVLILSRTSPSFYDIRHVMSRAVVEVELGGLDRESSRALAHTDGAYERTMGHPLYLELIERAGAKCAHGSMAEFVNVEIISKLSSDELSALQYASVVGRRLTRDALVSLAGCAITTINSLSAKCLLSEDDEGCYVPEPISDFARAPISQQRLAELHSSIADFLMNSEGFTNPAEPAYHLVQAGRLSDAVQLLYSLGATDESKTILDALEGRLIDTEDEAQLCILKGDILLMDRDFHSARLCYNKALDLSNDRLKEDAQSRLGELTMRERRWKETVEHYNQALKLARDSKDARRIARALINLGNAYVESEDEEHAREAFNEAETILIAKGESMGLSALYLARARVEAEPRACIEKAIKFASSSGYKKCEGAARLALASLGDASEGKKALEIFKSIGDEEGMLHASEALALCYMQAGLVEEIDALISRLAPGIFSKKCTRAAMRVCELAAEWTLSDGKRSCEYARRGLQFGNSGKLHLLNALGMRKSNDLDGAKREFELAASSFSDENDDEGVIVTLANLASMLKETGDVQGAKTKLDEALARAKRAKDIESQKRLSKMGEL